MTDLIHACWPKSRCPRSSARDAERAPPLSIFGQARVIQVVVVQLANLRALMSKARKLEGLEELSEEASSKARAQPPPPSQVKHCVWAMSCQVEESMMNAVVRTLKPNAEPLLQRGTDGGTDAVLSAVVFHVAPVMSHKVEAFGAATPVESDAVEVDPPLRIVAERTTKSVLHILLIYDPPGRTKAKVKRSVDSLFTGGRRTPSPAPETVQVVETSSSTAMSAGSIGTTLKFLTAKLAAITIEGTLELASMPLCRMCSSWPPGCERDLFEYLVQRKQMAGGSSDPAGHAVMARLGLDLLGPRRSRPQPLQPQPVKRLKLSSADEATAGASSTEAGPSTTEAGPSTTAGISPLQALLTFDGELTEAIAAERAAALCKTFHELTYELACTKLHLHCYKERDALEAQVCSNAFECSPPLSHDPNYCSHNHGLCIVLCPARLKEAANYVDSQLKDHLR